MGRELNSIDMKIIKLYQDGLAMRDIGQQVGKTKNSVCGLISRYREWGYLKPVVKRENKSIDLRKNPPKKVIGTRSSPIKMLHFRTIHQPPKKADQPPVQLDLPAVNGISFWKLKNNSCRFIVSGGNGIPHMYCGETQTRGSYCAYHGNICYIPNVKKSYGKYK